MDVKDRVVIVTGASMGIGLATARRFAQAGAKVVLAARSSDKLERIAAEVREAGYDAIAIPTDMRSRSEVERMVNVAYEHYGRIDILINNAGQAVAGTVADVDVDHFRQIIDLNIFGPLYAMQAAIPKMRLGGGGLIINVSSMVSKMHIPGISTYAASKAALNKISETAGYELAGDNIRVVTMYPRTTATDFGKNSLGNRGMRQQQRAHAEVKVDTAEQVADKILEAAEKEPAEQYME